MPARIVESLRHVPVERALAYRATGVVVFRQRRMAIREFRHAPSRATRALEAIPPVLFLLAGAAAVAAGGLMLRPSGGRGALAPASQNAMAAAFAKLKSGR